MTPAALIFGLRGPRLLSGERAFFRDVNPWGFILFARNIETPDQVKALTSELRETVGRNCLIFIDQEGGRVQRLRPPHWFDYPSLARVARLYEADPAAAQRSIFLHHRLIAADLRAIGVNANCAPVLDIPVPGADPIISDRALGGNWRQVTKLGHAAMAGLMTGGIAPVIKHIPGHGRATVDSHLALPKIETALEDLAKTDFRPFYKLNDSPMAMTAHLLLQALDSKKVVTTSKSAISFIRKQLGFSGLLMSDDLDMKALSGTLRSRTSACLSAGCDIALQCSGEMTAMVEMTKGARRLSGAALERSVIAENCALDPRGFDYDAGMAEYEALLFRERLAS